MREGERKKRESRRKGTIIFKPNIRDISKNA